MVPEYNILDHVDGTHVIKVLRTREKTKENYWDIYVHKGHILRLLRPKTGRIIQMPRGDRYKVAALGSDITALTGEQISVAYLRPWMV
jgi:hypothetical protein